MSGGGSVKQTPAQQLQQQAAENQWAQYETTWQPIQRYYQQRMEQGQGPARTIGLGQANADTQQRYGLAGSQLNAQQAARGAIPGSDASIFGQSSLAGMKAAAGGVGQTNEQNAIDRQYLSGLGSVMSMGTQQLSQSDNALSNLANAQGGIAEQTAQLNAQQAGGLGQAIGTGLGSGAGYGLQSYMSQIAAPESPGGGTGGDYGVQSDYGSLPITLSSPAAPPNMIGSPAFQSGLSGFPGG